MSLFVRNTSRMVRLTLFRTTALPTFLLAVIPRRFRSRSFVRKKMMKWRDGILAPSRVIRVKSLLLRILSSLDRPYRFKLTVVFVPWRVSGRGSFVLPSCSSDVKSRACGFF